MPKQPDIETNQPYKKPIEINSEKKQKNKEIKSKTAFVTAKNEK